MNFALLMVNILFSSHLLAITPTHEPDQKQIENIKISNKKKIVQKNQNPTPSKPFVEYQKAQYLSFSDLDSFNSKHIKDTIAKNLPPETYLVVLAGRDSPNYLKNLKQHYAQIMDENFLKIVFVYEHGFWSRDSLPVPIFVEKPEQDQLALVDARYYHGNTPDADISRLFNSPLISHNYYFEGGNILSNSQGICFVVDNKRLPPKELFIKNYACKKIITLEHYSGIGHVDEKIKIISDDVALTNEPRYVSILEEQGFQVFMLPSAPGKYATYANALLINHTVYLPIYNTENDQIAIKVYKDLNFNVVPINSEYLSNEGHGSFHCITMVYPEVEMEKLILSLQRHAYRTAF